MCRYALLVASWLLLLVGSAASAAEPLPTGPQSWSVMVRVPSAVRLAVRVRTEGCSGSTGLTATLRGTAVLAARLSPGGPPVTYRASRSVPPGRARLILSAGADLPSCGRTISIVRLGFVAAGRGARTAVRWTAIPKHVFLLTAGPAHTPQSPSTPASLPRSAPGAAVPTVIEGSAVRTEVLDPAQSLYASTLIKTVGSITPENELKWDAVEPAQGAFDFSTADRLVQWARTNGKQIRGHTLVWHNQLPAWLTSRSWSADDLRSVLKSHIQTVVGHYKGQVGEWDVVNEPFNSDGTMRHGIWLDTLGPDYIADALRWAHEADPSALLLINDYGNERFNAKSDALLALATQLKQSGVPLDGVGFQMHVQTNYFPTTAELLSNMQRFAQLGLHVEVTEMDVRTSTTPGSTAQKVAAQADVYRQAAAACQALNACTRFTTWGITDAITWLGSGEMPLLFDASYQPKPALAALKETFQPR